MKTLQTMSEMTRERSVDAEIVFSGLKIRSDGFYKMILRNALILSSLIIVTMITQRARKRMTKNVESLCKKNVCKYLVHRPT